MRISEMLLWDDLRMVLAVSRAGSLAGAAELMDVSAPTVFRHAKAAEERLGALLFLRDTTGVSLSPAGRDAAAVAERIEAEIGAFEGRVGNQDNKAAGVVRLATVDTLVAGPLMPVLRDFRSAHPRIVLDVQSGVAMANLRQREVDAALRAGGEPPDDLVGRRLCRIEVAVYRAVDSPVVDEADFEKTTWVAPDDHLSHLASVKWLKARGYYAPAGLRANSLHTLSLAVANGVGLGVLPCYLADPDPKLVRVGDTIGELGSDLWFLTHEELRGTARIRVLSNFLADRFQRLKPLFLGNDDGAY